VVSVEGGGIGDQRRLIALFQVGQKSNPKIKCYFFSNRSEFKVKLYRFIYNLHLGLP